MSEELAVQTHGPECESQYPRTSCVWQRTPVTSALGVVGTQRPVDAGGSMAS